VLCQTPTNNHSWLVLVEPPPALLALQVEEAPLLERKSMGDHPVPRQHMTSGCQLTPAAMLERGKREPLETSYWRAQRAYEVGAPAAFNLLDQPLCMHTYIHAVLGTCLNQGFLYGQSAAQPAHKVQLYVWVVTVPVSATRACEHPPTGCLNCRRPSRLCHSAHTPCHTQVIHTTTPRPWLQR
jgi:hypothetical protein